MQIKIAFLEGDAKTPQLYRDWRQSLGRQENDRSLFEENFIRLFVREAASKLGKLKSTGFDSIEVASNAFFTGYIERRGKALHIVITGIRMR